MRLGLGLIHDQLVGSAEDETDTPAVPEGNVRITQASNTRITQAGNTRITQQEGASP